MLTLRRFEGADRDCFCDVDHFATGNEPLIGEIEVTDHTTAWFVIVIGGRYAEIYDAEDGYCGLQSEQDPNAVLDFLFDAKDKMTRQEVLDLFSKHEVDLHKTLILL